MSTEELRAGRKRKADDLKDEGEIEVDLNAPEPPSKKNQRKAKKSKSHPKDRTDDPKADENANDISTDTNLTNGSPPAPQSHTKSTKKSTSEYGIWIGNLAFFTTKDDLVTFLTKPETGILQSDITRTNLPQGPPRNGSKSQNKGFAYVDFASKESQDAAIGLSEKLLGGRRVLIKSDKNFDGRPEKPENNVTPSTPSSKRIFVGNLSFDVTADDLRQHFSRCGTIETLHMATFQDSGKCKGYAWVTFEDLSAAEAAVRGWVEVLGDPEEDAGELELEEDAAPTKSMKARSKRTYVNKILGRKLRMEFAEDPTTRYHKRFGKGATTSTDDSDETNGVPNSGSNDRQQQSDRKVSRRRDRQDKQETRPDAKPRRERDPTKGKQDNSRYEQATVQRLTGAAVAGEGKKITFD